MWGHPGGHWLARLALVGTGSSWNTPSVDVLHDVVAKLKPIFQSQECHRLKIRNDAELGMASELCHLDAVHL